MSKSISGLFIKTLGNRQYYSDMDLQKQVTSWARNVAESLEKISKRKRDSFNTASVVYDVVTGKYYNGRNQGIELEKSDKNPILFGGDNSPGLLPSKSLNAFVVGNCAEIHAVNKALNDNAKLSNLIMYTIHTTKSSFGKPKAACENCTFALKNHIISNYSGWS